MKTTFVSNILSQSHFKSSPERSALNRARDLFVLILTCLLFIGLHGVLAEDGSYQSNLVFDNFNDGGFEDGSPAQWIASHRGADFDFDASSGELVITRREGAASNVWFTTRNQKLADTSVRAQMRLSGSASNVFVWAQYPSNGQSGWVAGFLFPDGLLRISHQSGGGGAAEFKTDLRVAEEDVILQMDIVGDNVSLYAWRPGEPMPEAPQVVRVVSSVQSGELGGGMQFPELNSSVTFRYIMFSSEPIRSLRAAPELKIERDAVLLSYQQSAARESQLESKDEGVFGQWSPELQPGVVVDGERKVGFSKEEAEGKDFRLTGDPFAVGTFKIDRNALLLSYEVRNFDHWRIESHPTLTPEPGAQWQRVEVLDSGNVRRAFVPVREPLEFFRTSLTTDEYFRDEFSNEESPVTWTVDPTWPMGKRERTEEGWEWTPASSNMGENVNHSYDDVSIHTQFRLLGPGDFSGVNGGVYIWARNTYLAGIKANGTLLIWTKLQQIVITQPTDLDVANNDIHLQLDFVGDLLKLWAWEDGTGKPEEPQISYTDNESKAGIVGLFYNRGIGNATIAFRSFELTRLNAIRSN